MGFMDPKMIHTEEESAFFDDLIKIFEKRKLKIGYQKPLTMDEDTLWEVRGDRVRLDADEVFRFLSDCLEE
jgi:hypothetical protein